jgi:hypothetical protein
MHGPYNIKYVTQMFVLMKCVFNRGQPWKGITDCSPISRERWRTFCDFAVTQNVTIPVTVTVTAARRVLIFIQILLIALYGFTAMVWKPHSCSYGYEFRAWQHENLVTVVTNDIGLVSDTNYHNGRHKQTFADRTKVLYVTIGVLTTGIEAWSNEVTESVIISTYATSSSPPGTLDKL